MAKVDRNKKTRMINFKIKVYDSYLIQLKIYFDEKKIVNTCILLYSIR